MAIRFNSGNLNGLAQQVLSLLGISIPPVDVELAANLSKFYIAAISRNCTNSTNAPAADYYINLLGTTLLPSYTTPIIIFERSYILLGTTTGGDVNYMVYPYIIVGKLNFVVN